MATMDSAIPLEDQIDQWRSYLRRRQVIHPVDVAELEDHLREQIAQLSAAGLSNDEAFLVAVRRMGGLDQLSREFAREHSERLWKQLVASSVDIGQSRQAERKDAIVAICLALAAALAIKAPALFGLTLEGDNAFYARNLGLFVLPLLTGYFIWKRKAGGAMVRWLAAAFVLALLVANFLPLAPRGATDGLRALHLPIALWLAVGVAYAGKRWNEVGGRMDFIRFSGELFIYYVLIGLGGGVLTAFMMMIFMTVGINVEWIFVDWLLPCGAMGALIVAARLVEAKQSVIENMAPVLARLFTPLFAAVLIVFLAVMVWTGRGIDIQRDMLIAFDLLLVVVLGLLLYSVSARDPLAPRSAYDWLQLVLVVSALLADAIALWAIAARIGEFGVTPNRIAALGENLVLLVNLIGAALYSVRFLRAKGSFADIERWQTNYLPVYAAWAVIVVVVFPPVFGFV